MKLKVQLIKIETGFSPVVTINHRDAIRYDLHPRDRVLIETVGKKRGRRAIAVVDIIMTDQSLKEGNVGVLLEAASELSVKDGDTVDIHPDQKPDSVRLIKKKNGWRPTQRQRIRPYR